MPAMNVTNIKTGKTIKFTYPTGQTKEQAIDAFHYFNKQKQEAAPTADIAPAAGDIAPAADIAHPPADMAHPADIAPPVPVGSHYADKLVSGIADYGYAGAKTVADFVVDKAVAISGDALGVATEALTTSPIVKGVQAGIAPMMNGISDYFGWSDKTKKLLTTLPDGVDVEHAVKDIGNSVKGILPETEESKAIANTIGDAMAFYTYGTAAAGDVVGAITNKEVLGHAATDYLNYIAPAHAVKIASKGANLYGNVLGKASTVLKEKTPALKNAIDATAGSKRMDAAAMADKAGALGYGGTYRAAKAGLKEAFSTTAIYDGAGKLIPKDDAIYAGVGNLTHTVIKDGEEGKVPSYFANYFAKDVDAEGNPYPIIRIAEDGRAVIKDPAMEVEAKVKADANVELTKYDIAKLHADKTYAKNRFNTGAVAEMSALLLVSAIGTPMMGAAAHMGMAVAKGIRGGKLPSLHFKEAVERQLKVEDMRAITKLFDKPKPVADPTNPFKENRMTAPSTSLSTKLKQLPGKLNIANLIAGSSLTNMQERAK